MIIMNWHQGDFNFGTSSQADFILIYYLSKFLEFPKISSNLFSNSPFPPSPAGRLEQLKPPWSTVNARQANEHFNKLTLSITIFESIRQSNSRQNSRKNMVAYDPSPTSWCLGSASACWSTSSTGGPVSWTLYLIVPLVMLLASMNCYVHICQLKVALRKSLWQNATQNTMERCFLVFRFQYEWRMGITNQCDTIEMTIY